MSNLTKEVKISRFSLLDGHYHGLHIAFVNPNTNVWYSDEMLYDWCNNEDEAVVILLNNFVEAYYSDYFTIISVEQLKLKVTEGFRRLRENDYIVGYMDICLIPQGPHFSCKMKQNDDDTTKSSGEGGISQSKVQQKLAFIEKENKIMTFFEDNKCSVCLSSYKDILDDNLHIVIPSCGHPLCC